MTQFILLCRKLFFLFPLGKLPAILECCIDSWSGFRRISDSESGVFYLSRKEGS